MVGDVSEALETRCSAAAMMDTLRYAWVEDNPRSG